MINNTASCLLIQKRGKSYRDLRKNSTMMLFCNTLLLLFVTTQSSSIGVTVFEPWEGGYPCIRIPSITATSDGTLVAFAECRAWIGDGCHPNNNTTTITSKISVNQNDRWICQKNKQ
eukprot:268748_1